MDRLLLTDANVQDILSLSERAVDRLRLSGALPCVTVEGHRRFRMQDVQAFVERLGGPAMDAVPRIIPGPMNPRAKKKAG